MKIVSSARDAVTGKTRLLRDSGYELEAHEVKKVNVRKIEQGFTVFMRLVGNFRNVQQEVLGLVCSIFPSVFAEVLRRPLP